MEKKRYANIDLLKTIAIIMVIALHSQLFITDFIKDNKISTYIQYFIRILCEGVAIFILVNGFLLIKNICNISNMVNYINNINTINIQRTIKNNRNNKKYIYNRY